MADLFDFSSPADEETKEDLQHSFSDNSIRLIQTSDSRTQSVYLSDHVKVEPSNQLDTDDNCKQSYSACDAEMHVETAEHKFTCTVCSKKFKQASDLKRHMRIHTGERPYSCNYCGKKFSDSGGLKSHTRNHTGDKPFRCKVCSKSFACSTHLKRHMSTHFSGGPVSCKLCDVSFLYWRDFKYHDRLCQIRNQMHLFNHKSGHTSEKDTDSYPRLTKWKTVKKIGL